MAAFTFSPGDRVSIERGPFAGRSGFVKRNCSQSFADFCMVTLDKNPRERSIKTAMIACAALATIGTPNFTENEAS